MKKTILLLSLAFMVASCKSNPPCSTPTYNLKHKLVTNRSGLRQNVGSTLEYYIPLTVNGQNLEFIADTGSSNLVVDNTSNQFNVSNLKSSGSSFPISYGEGSTIINVQNYQGPVDFQCGPGLSNYYIGSITSCSGNGCAPQIMGLAYSAVALGDQDATFWTDFVATTKVSDEFSTLLCGVAHDANSQIIFGGTNPSLGAFTDASYTPIKEKSWYVIQPQTFSIEGDNNPIGTFPQAILPCADNLPQKGDKNGSSNCTILDSGTTISQIPVGMYNALKNRLIAANSNLPAATDCFWPDSCPQQTELSCSSVRSANLPNIIITFEGGLQLSIRQESYMKSTDGNNCVFGFAPTANNFIILGQAVMENQYIHFDRKNHRIGFAGGFKACGN